MSSILDDIMPRNHSSNWMKKYKRYGLGHFIKTELLYIDLFTFLDCNVGWMKVSKRWLVVNVIEQL